MEKGVIMNTLECSSKGDKKFSAFYAYTTVFGIYGGDENTHRFSDGMNRHIANTFVR